MIPGHPMQIHHVSVNMIKDDHKWHPSLRWMVVEGSARTPEDFGQLVFCDPTATRWGDTHNHASIPAP